VLESVLVEVLEAVDEAELEVLEGDAVKFSGFRCPQLAFSLVLQRF